MTSFEQMLLDKGYLKYSNNSKTKELELDNSDFFSTMGVLEYTYIYPTTKRKVVFGLSEKGKPPTLIYPRPKILLFRGGDLITEIRDDAVNVALLTFDNEYIYKAMFDSSITIVINNNK